MADTAIHVEPKQGRWAVRHNSDVHPVSLHDDAGAAMRAACACGDPQVRVLLHDLYGRIHEVAASRPDQGRRPVRPGCEAVRPPRHSEQR
jgi:hypothetical protein